MKRLLVGFALFGLCCSNLIADYTAPFLERGIGHPITSSGTLLANSNGAAGFMVRVRTDAGPKFLPATVPTNIDVRPLLGEPAGITATVRLEGQNRWLEIIDIKALQPKHPTVQPIAPERATERATVGVWEMVARITGVLVIVSLIGFLMFRRRARAAVK